MLNNVRNVVQAIAPLQRANAPLAAALERVRGDNGVGPEWQLPAYGEYYARSADVYAAVKLRADSIARPPLIVMRRDPSTGSGQAGTPLPVGHDHPVQRLLDRANDWWSAGDLIGATETYLSLWGAEFWYLSRNELGDVVEIWPLRPDKVRIVRDGQRYAEGFVYRDAGVDFPMLPEEVVWFRYFNPLDEFAGFSPMAAARLTADLGMEALRFNSDFFKNGAHPQDLVFKANGPVTDDQVESFYKRLEQRFTGRGRWQRPIVTGDGWDVQHLGLNQRDMEWLAGLRWSLEGVARVYGVPLPLLEDFGDATYNNVREARRMFWEKTVVPELRFLEGEINEGLLPKLGRQADGLQVAFDLSSIEALGETETERTGRQVELVDAGILTINEVRRERGLPDVGWGDAWAGPRPARRGDGEA